jgi:ABC-type microcin C transport system permease subunit YejB
MRGHEDIRSKSFDHFVRAREQIRNKLVTHADKFDPEICVTRLRGRRLFEFREPLLKLACIGQLLTQAVLNRDYPMVQGGLLITTALLVLVNIGVDVCYALLDPRVRYDDA